MPARRLDGIVDSEQSGSSRADDISLDAWLRDQILERGVNVARQLPAYLCPLLGRQFLIRRAAALAMSSHIECKRVDSSRCQLPGQIIPRFARPVDLMQQQHAGTRLGRGKVGCLQDGSVSRLQVNHNPRQRLLWCWGLRRTRPSGALCALPERPHRSKERRQEDEDWNLFHSRDLSFPPELFVPQCGPGIDPYRAPRRKVRSEQGNTHEKKRDTRKREWVGRPHAVKQSCHQVRHDQGANKSNGGTRQGKPQALTENNAQDVPSFCA